MASTVVVPRVTNSIPNPVNDPAVIAPALANAALLVAAPSLGCLRTYISILTDLHQANGLPVPDLELVHGNVDFQFYRQYHAHTDATVPDNEGEIDPFPCVVTPIEGARPELAHDTPNESELMGTSTTSSDVGNSSVCDSPKVNKNDLLVKLGTTSTPTSSTATRDMLNSSYIFTPTRKRTTSLQFRSRKLTNATEEKSSTDITKTHRTSIRSKSEKKIQQPMSLITFSCLLCSRVFRSKSELRRHLVIGACTRPTLLLRAVTKGCEGITCAKSFNDRGQAERHTRSHLYRKGILCPVCQEEFTKQDEGFLIRHVMEIHPKYLEGLGCTMYD